MNERYRKLREKYGEKLPVELPGAWRFPPPPVCSAQWDSRDWIAYAAIYNGFTLNDKEA